MLRYNKVMSTKEKNNNRYEKLVEASTWIAIILLIFGVRFLPQKLIDEDTAYILIGVIISTALLYYLIVYKYFSRTNRLYIKNITDIILIGILIHLLKDYGTFFYALYFLPIAAAALSLEFISALLIATIAAVFVTFEIFLSSQDLISMSSIFQRLWQVGMIIFMTIFCRFLALQIKQEKNLREESLARQKLLEEEAKRQKEFLSLTSHQLYTPLSITRGFTSMLYDGNLGELSAKQKDAVKEIYSSTKRMTNLVEELLSISRIQSGKYKINLAKTDLKSLLESINKQFTQTQLKPGLQIEMELPKELEEVMIDQDKIRQVISNLVDNAVKYSDKGKIKINVQQYQKETLISVSDDGKGVSKEDRDKLFEPFFRGTNILEIDNRGTGLGLYIARLIINHHKGKIWLEPKEKGAEFKFSLPR